MADLRKAAVNWKGTPTDVIGSRLEVGGAAPSEFTLSANDLSGVSGGAIAGRSRIVCSVPSLDTAVCDIDSRH